MTRIALPPVIDLAAASVLADTLRGAALPIECDGSAVTRIGIAGLQVLLSARLTAAAAGLAFTIAAASEALHAAARTAGVADLLAPVPVPISGR